MRNKEKYVKFHLTDLQTNRFCVLLNGDMQRKLIGEAAEKISKRDYGKYKNLAIYLQNKCKGFSKIKAESIWNRYIPLWKSNKMFIPIDCLLELYKVTNRSLEGIESSVERIKCKNSPNKSAIKFSFVYDENVASIAEIIKADGHLKRDFRQTRITNKSVELINHIKDILKTFNLTKLYETLTIEADIPNENIVRIINDCKEFRFSIRKLKKKMKIRFTDNFEYGKIKDYKIVFNDNSIIKLNIKIPLNSNIVAKSSFAVCSATIDLHITNMTFCRLMNVLCNVPPGKKSRLIEFPEFIFNSPANVQRAVISSIMACESWVEVGSKRIRFFVESKDYILQLKKLFEMFGIYPSIDNRGYLNISSRKDLMKFSENFDFIINEKNDKFKEALDTYERFIFRHEEGLIRTLKLLNKYNRLDAYQLAKKLEKHKDTAFLHLNSGIRNGFVDKDISILPYSYSITKDGRKFLGEKNVMFGD